MADGTGIEWTDATWQPITGCSIVSPGCVRCYAMKLAGGRLRNHPSRKGLTEESRNGPVWTGEVRFNEQWLTQPLKWREPKKIFVCAHGDLFHEAVPDGWIMRVLWVMGQARHHKFQVLTKRATRMREFFAKWCDVNPEQDLDFKNARGPEAVRAAHKSGRGQLFADMLDAMGKPPAGAAYPLFDWAGGMSRWPDVLPNVWLGVSTEDQRRADERIPDLLATPAAVRFISAEPLLGPIDLTNVGSSTDTNARLGINAFNGHVVRPAADRDFGKCWPALDWVIAGGESGNAARPMHPDWARSLRDQCAAAGVAFFFKQWGNWYPEIDRDRDDPDWRQPYSDYCEPHFQILNLAGGRGFHGDRVHVMRLCSKKSAGRLLDGVEHSAFPARAA